MLELAGPEEPKAPLVSTDYASSETPQESSSEAASFSSGVELRGEFLKLEAQPWKAATIADVSAHFEGLPSTKTSPEAGDDSDTDTSSRLHSEQNGAENDYEHYELAEEMARFGEAPPSPETAS